MRNAVRALALLVLFTLPAVASAEGMTLEQISKLRSVGSAAISPDGAHIAYTLNAPRTLPEDEDGPAWTELHVVDAEGNSRGYIVGEENVASIGWMPDGSAVTFLAKRGDDETRRLYAVPIDGGEARPIATLETDISGYSFSPDGERAALLAFEPEPEALEQQREMGFTQTIFEEDWRPRRLYIAELNDADFDPRMLEIDGSVQEAHWSPAGDRIALSVTPRELVDDTLMFKRIRIVSPQGDELGRIDNPGKLGEIAWSPDGERLAFIATESIRDTAAGRLMVARKGGGAWTNLLPDLEGHVRSVGWRDNQRVVFVSHEGVNARLGAVRHNGRGETTLIPGGGPIFGSLTVSDGGRIAMTADAPAHPTEVFIVSRDGRRAERLTNSNPWLEDVTLARQEVVTYSARDGLEIEGILFYPLDYQRGRRYPLILGVHGGPESHYSNGWITRYSMPAHHAAAEGYFMFFPNYRGSTGRGVEFALTSQGRPSKEEFDDLVDGVDHLIERGLVDPDQVGVTGGSYGGYASAWCATYYTDRFAAAVMFVGLSDLISKVGTSDIPREMYLVHNRAWPWDDWNMFVEASPIHYADQADTPILILHGDSDPRVDPTQSRILYRYISLQDDPPPVRLVLYEGEGHGNRRAASRYDYSLRLMRWMNHYLKGPGGDPPDARLDYGLDEEE